jgi:hypothetical protein
MLTTGMDKKTRLPSRIIGHSLNQHEAARSRVFRFSTLEQRAVCTMPPCRPGRAAQFKLQLDQHQRWPWGLSKRVTAGSTNVREMKTSLSCQVKHRVDRVNRRANPVNLLKSPHLRKAAINSAAVNEALTFTHHAGRTAGCLDDWPWPSTHLHGTVLQQAVGEAAVD